MECSAYVYLCKQLQILKAKHIVGYCFAVPGGLMAFYIKLNFDLHVPPRSYKLLKSILFKKLIRHLCIVVYVGLHTRLPHPGDINA